MKSNFTLSIVVFLVLCVSAYGQKTATKTAIKAEIWKEYVAPDKSYKILFPEQTELDKFATQQLRETVKADEKDKLVIAGTLSFGIIYKDFSAAPVDEMERSARYQLQISRLGYQTKDVSVGKLQGVEFSAELKQGGLLYDNISRLFLVQQRLFNISIAVPSLDKLPPAQRAIYRAKVDKFFNSFTPLVIPPAKYEPIPLLPKDFKITSNGQTFKSEALNLSIRFPANWITETHDPNRKPNPETEKENIMMRWHWRSGVGVMGAGLQEKKASIGININRRHFADVMLKEYVDEIAGLVGSFSEKQTSLAIKPITINGRDFLMFEQTKDGIKEEYYYADSGKWILEIWVRYAEESDKKIIEDALKTLTFAK